jgi:pimeloyl-ACP methyl ester carboxylesterase
MLIGGLTDPSESWEAQLEGLSDRYRVIAYDNRGTGRTPLGDEPLTVELMARDAVGILRALDIESAHVAGFSGGSLIGQELALSEPAAVRSLVLQSTWTSIEPRFHAVARSWRRLVERSTSERAMLEDFLIWVYTARAYADGTVDAIVDESLAFPHPQTAEAFQAQLDAFMAFDAHDRLPEIAAPTLVLAGGDDIMAPPRLGRAVADLIPDARFEVLAGEAHQPFQEVPARWNSRVEAFWRAVEAERSTDRPKLTTAD